jgi:hypothetical protein
VKKKQTRTKTKAKKVPYITKRQVIKELLARGMTEAAGLLRTMDMGGREEKDARTAGEWLLNRFSWAYTPPGADFWGHVRRRLDLPVSHPDNSCGAAEEEQSAEKLTLLPGDVIEHDHPVSRKKLPRMTSTVMCVFNGNAYELRGSDGIVRHLSAASLSILRAKRVGAKELAEKVRLDCARSVKRHLQLEATEVPGTDQLVVRVSKQSHRGCLFAVSYFGEPPLQDTALPSNEFTFGSLQLRSAGGRPRYDQDSPANVTPVYVRGSDFGGDYGWFLFPKYRLSALKELVRAYNDTDGGRLPLPAAAGRELYPGGITIIE